MPGDLGLLSLFILLERPLFWREAMALEDEIGQLFVIVVRSYFGVVGLIATTVALVKWLKTKL